MGPSTFNSGCVQGLVAPLGPWQGRGAAALTRFFPETWGSHTHTSHGWCPGNECHPWGGARLEWPRGFHGASGELWVATVCPDVGSLPGDPRVGRGAAPGTPPRLPLPGSPPLPRPDLSPALSHSQRLVSGSASPRRLLVLFGELSLAHAFSACLHFPVALLVGIASPLPPCGGSWPCGKVSDLPEVRFPTLEIGITNSREVQGRRQMMLEGQ